ncbi:dioxygenase family protein [Piscinibacter koreensis]|uniref:Dioxygenase n=1 Tax=Piscinibacter koreensis TaxID=2742824 RepID=A0A7Y6NPC0_9BURK|nr:class III extradiol ring-cleavage dioxygenase [Schlegelella koreensis]NUZ06882.1 dioxygenase [Schlegelella koreensis]
MNTTSTLPALFVSHGSPMIALEPGAAGAFLRRLGPAIDATFGRPRAIVAISAHTAARSHVLLAGARHQAIYDFGGFDPRLSTLRYDAPGHPALAADVATRLQAAGIDVHRVDRGGLDHGIWTALRYVYPEADVPVLPLAFDPARSPAEQFALGAALAPLRDDGVLVLGTGSITHNLRRVFASGLRAPMEQPEIPESAAFRDWFVANSRAHDWDALFDYRRRAPHAVDMHPTDEHLLPWFVAAGAGGRDATPHRLHTSVTFGSLGMDAYAFGAEAGRLDDALVASARSTMAT